MPSEKPANGPSSLVSFIALYFTTLFSLDTWAAARASPYRDPSSLDTYARPANPTPSPDSYQGSMHGRGNAGPGSGSSGGRGPARVPQVVDSRPPLRMAAGTGCSACAL